MSLLYAWYNYNMHSASCNKELFKFEMFPQLSKVSTLGCSKIGAPSPVPKVQIQI